MLFEYCNKQYNYKSYDFGENQWPKLKKEHVFAHDELPVLELSDGTHINQTLNILRFVSKRLGMTPTDELTAAKVDEAAELAQEIWFNANVSLNGLASEEQKQDFCNNKWPTYAKYFAEMVGDKNFVVGNTPTYADFVLWHICDAARTLMPSTLDDTQTLKSFYERVGKLPGVADYLNKRPEL